MKKLTVLFTSVLSIFLLTSTIFASANHSVENIKGVKIISNKNKPSIDELGINLQEQLSIESDYENSESIITHSSFQVDKDGNLFIYDIPNKKINKFDKSGNFVKAFGRTGSGPGEYQGAMSTVVVDNKIYAIDQIGRKLVVFENNGEFIKNISVPSLPVIFEGIDNGSKFIGLGNYQEQKDNKMYLGVAIILYNSEFKEIKKIWKKEMELNPESMSKIPEFLEAVPTFTSSKDRVYIAEKDKNSYRVETFDFDGNPKEKIKRDYRKIKMTKKELDDASTTMKVIVSTNDGNDDAEKNLKNDDKYKNSISNILVDKNNRLWVLGATDGKKMDTENFNFIDIYDADGVFLNTHKIDKQLHNFYFKNNKLYAFEGDDNIIKVFNY